MNDCYEVVFSCPWANYWWISDKNLSLEEAEKIAIRKNKRKQIHGNRGCCRYYAQKRDEDYE